jgi:MFS family permease
VMNVVFAVSAYPVGVISDRLGRHGLLTAGFAVLILADLVLAMAPGLWAVLIGVALWGLHMGMTQGVLAALVSNSAPATLRGSAFGVFHLVTGLATLLASVIAGALWTWVGPAGTFLGGALFAVLGLTGMVVARRPRPSAQ